MKNYFITVILIIMISILYSFGQDEYANASLSGQSSYNDFANIKVYASGSAGYYWFCNAYYWVDWKNGSNWIQEDSDTEFEDWDYSGIWEE